ncbi:MAG: restriction endonuclease subunit S [Lachnospiraceae bacterium]
MVREMKDSGIEWIGEIGFDFYMMKLKYVSIILDQFRKPVTADQRSQEGEMLYDYYGASGAIDKINGYTIDDHVMLIGEDGANLKMRNLPLMYEVNGKAWINNHAHILKPKQGIDFYYLFYVLEAIDINPYITGSAQPKLSQENLKNIWIPVPNVNIQKEIVCCIKDACIGLDNILEKTRSSIEEYKKLKQSVITKAVTKGVRGNREMKDSQSMWFGQIPDDWNMRKMKYIFKIQKYIAGEEGHTVLSITQKGIKPKDLSKNEGQLAESYSNYQLVHIGDFAMNHMDLLTGWVDVSKYEGVTSPDYRVFGLIDKDNYCSQYYLYLMQMCYTNRIFYGLGQGVSGLGRWRLQADKFLNFSITVPSYEEQQEIANYLDKKCSAIDELIAKKEQYLSEIENYKKSLIYEYVTGKKEV